jgi:hypothetical protein
MSKTFSDLELLEQKLRTLPGMGERIDAHRERRRNMTYKVTISPIRDPGNKRDWVQFAWKSGVKASAANESEVTIGPIPDLGAVIQLLDLIQDNLPGAKFEVWQIPADGTEPSPIISGSNDMPDIEL